MLNIVKELISGSRYFAVIGLGYVGLPIAYAFSKKVQVIGYDSNQEKIEMYRSGKDPTGEVGDDNVSHSSIQFSADEEDLKRATFFIVAVPTPVHMDKTPDLSPIENASRLVGRNLTKNAIVVFESTVYPGVTENICIPLLEEESGLKCGVDFKVGYSPERVNPGDKIHQLHSIQKIVAGMDEETLEVIAQVYDLVIDAGVYRASSIKVAEAAKLAENTQRDINIAFMNELSLVFHKMEIETKDVLAAMNTKWNALGFEPGLVGGHCIGVDPYYFIYEAENLGYHSQIILAGRNINNSMGEFVVQAVIQKMICANKRVKEANVYILGAAFKENCPDLRNSRVSDIVANLREYGVSPCIVDPVADQSELKREYDACRILSLEEIRDADCIIVAVAHEQFCRLNLEDINAMYQIGRDGEEKVLIDVKNIFDSELFKNAGYVYWSL